MQYIKPLNEWIDLNQDVLFELSNDTTLYHRSMRKMKVGDIIQPAKNKDGNHWLQQKLGEVALEKLRLESYPDRPSRFTAIYSSIVPRSRFVDKGYLYAIKPIGNLFITDSTLIEIINTKFDRELWDRGGLTGADEFGDALKNGDENTLQELLYMLPWEADEYWKGGAKGDFIDLEVLSDSAVVVEVIPDTNRLKIGQTVKVIEDGLIAAIDLNINSRSNNKQIFTDEEATNFIEDVKINIFQESKITRKYIEEGKGKDGTTSYAIRLEGPLKRGLKLHITYIQSGLLHKNSKNFGDASPGKYSNIMFDFWMNGKLYRRGDEAPLFRLEAQKYNNPQTFDMGKYLK